MGCAETPQRELLRPTGGTQTGADIALNPGAFHTSAFPTERSFAVSFWTNALPPQVRYQIWTCFGDKAGIGQKREKKNNTRKLHTCKELKQLCNISKCKNKMHSISLSLSLSLHISPSKIPRNEKKNEPNTINSSRAQFALNIHL